MSGPLWARFGLVSSALARALPTRSPPLLIVSLPRSGSSWVGKTLGRASDALYLREPISQSHLALNKRRGVVFNIDPSSLPPGYAASARAAFDGVPAFPANVVTFPGQWRLSARRRSRLVIKEVNPLALEWLIREYRPRIIYLIRHPAAVAASFARLGWLAEERHPDMEARFSAQRLGLTGADLGRVAGSPWAEHGALQALVMERALRTLADHDDHLVVRYEEICAEPVALFRRLFDFAGLRWDSGMEEKIVAETELAEHNRYETYSTHRSSRTLIDSWRTEVAPDALAELKRAFLSFAPAHYREEW
jgi:hypothetical protein